MTLQEKAFAWLDFQARHVDEIQWLTLRKFGMSDRWCEGMYRKWKAAQMSDIHDEMQGRSADTTAYRIEEDADPAPRCYCGREVPENGDSCSVACRAQALEEMR